MRELEDHSLIDDAAWTAHHRADLRLDLDVEPAEWVRYVDGLTSDAKGFWHGLTGALSERVGADDASWQEMIAVHDPAPAECVGDTSHDFFYLMEWPGDSPRVRARKRGCYQRAMGR
jgi:hypothetical protein